MHYKASDQNWIDDDLITHFRFIATMQLRTPYCVLARHNETYWDRSAQPPIFFREPWQGIWVPGIDVTGRMDHVSMMASEIGPVPAMGSDFHRFLLVVRQIAESIDDADERCDEIARECRRDPWTSIVEKLGGAENVADRFCGAVSKA